MICDKGLCSGKWQAAGGRCDMKMKKTVSWILSLMLVFTMIPALTSVANAEDSTDFPAISIGSGDIKKGDKVYMGVRNINGSIVPISWLVLGGANSTNLKDGNVSVDPSDARLLIAEKIQEGAIFFNSNGGNAWQKSTAQTWCRDFLTGSDNGTDRFTAEEEAVPLSTSKSEGLYGDWGVSSLENERLFFLSAEEASDSNYFSNDDSRIAYRHDYETYDWWLRSPYRLDSSDAACVTPDGEVGVYDVLGRVGARPAFNFNLKSALFLSAAEGGKSSGAAGADALRKISTTSTNEWKLTLHDSSLDIAQYSAASGAVLSAAEGYDSWSVSIIGETEFAVSPVADDNEYISAILADSSGKALYYGHIANSKMVNLAYVTIPAGLSAGEYKLYIFSEQINDDKFTDYASAFSTIDLTVEALPVETFTVTFKAEGGSWQDGTTEKTQTVESGQAATAPADPTREGFTFDGWDTDFSNVTSSITVRAKWKEKESPTPETFEVTFDANGGKWSDETTEKKQTVESGQAATAPADPTRDDYDFDGWDTDFSNVTSSITVRAKWKEKESPTPETFEVTFDANGGKWWDGTTESKTLTFESGQTVTAPGELAMEGYDLKGWYVGDDPVELSSITSSMEVNAHWEKHLISIQDAEVVLSKTTFTYNKRIQKPAIETIGGMTLTEGTDYTAEWSKVSPKNAGEYSVTITGAGNYTGTTEATYEIKKAKNPLKVKAKSKVINVSYKELKIKSIKLKRSALIKFKNNIGDVKKYKLAPVSKKYKGCVTIQKSGKLRFKQDCKKGTCTVTIQVKAKGNKNYMESEWIKVRLKIKIT